MQYKQKIYTAEDIRKYVDGLMTNEQMHAIEKAALDDPFLAEAIEGYQLEKPVANRVALDELELKLQRRINQTPARIVALHPKKRSSGIRNIAAVLIFLTISALLYFVLNNKKESGSDNTMVATTKSKPASQDAATQPLPAGKQPARIQDNSQRIKEGAGNSDNSFTDNRDIALKPGNNTSTPDGENKKEVVTESKPTILAQNNGSSVQPTDSITIKNDIASKSKQRESDEAKDAVALAKKESSAKSNSGESAISKTFAAQVLGPDNTPLPFAKINIINDHIGTYADAKGNFILVSTDSLIELEIKSVGYLPKYYNLRSDAANKIVLQEDKLALKNVTEVTTASGKKLPTVRGRFIRDSAQNVEPADGWDLYGSYVDNNIEVPESVINNNIKGTVELSFEVKRNGNISNAKVDKSLCEDCDEEALRLIKQGPQWKVKKGKKARSKVKVQF